MCYALALLFTNYITFLQVELARKFEGLDLFKNDEHPQFSLVQARKDFFCFLNLIINIIPFIYF